MASWLIDEFDGAAGTELSLHAPDLGSAWAKHPNPGSAGSADALLTGAGSLRPVGATLYYNAEEPPSADVAIEGEMRHFGVGSPMVAARLDLSGLTGYFARRSRTFWDLWKWVGGVFSPLASFPWPAPESGLESFRFAVEGTTLTLSVGGVVLPDATDSEIPGPGYVGVRFTAGATDSTGIHVDRLEASPIPSIAAGLGSARVLPRSAAHRVAEFGPGAHRIIPRAANQRIVPR